MIRKFLNKFESHVPQPLRTIAKIALAAGVILFIWAKFPYWAEYFFPQMSEDISTETAGQFGDLFGSLNTLFSALAFGGVIWSIFLQRKELQETRLEFRTQNETLKRQRFERTRSLNFLN